MWSVTAPCFASHPGSGRGFRGSHYIRQRLQRHQETPATGSAQKKSDCWSPLYTYACALRLRSPTSPLFLETGIFKGPRQHVRDGGNHHPAESRRQRHKGQLLLFLLLDGFLCVENTVYSRVPLTSFQQAEVPEDSDDDDPDEVFGFITMLNLTERKVILIQNKEESVVKHLCL